MGRYEREGLVECFKSFTALFPGKEQLDKDALAAIDRLQQAFAAQDEADWQESMGDDL